MRTIPARNLKEIATDAPFPEVDKARPSYAHGD